MRIAVPSTALFVFSVGLFRRHFPKTILNVEQKPEQLLTYHQDTKPILERGHRMSYRRRDRKLCADQLRQTPSSLPLWPVRWSPATCRRGHRATIRCLALSAQMEPAQTAAAAIGSKAVRRVGDATVTCAVVIQSPE